MKIAITVELRETQFRTSKPTTYETRKSLDHADHCPRYSEPEVGPKV